MCSRKKKVEVRDCRSHFIDRPCMSKGIFLADMYVKVMLSSVIVNEERRVSVLSSPVNYFNYAATAIAMNP